MDNRVGFLELQLTKCRQILNTIFSNTRIGDLNRLNNFCAEVLKFAKVLHTFIGDTIEMCAIEGNEHVEIIFVTLAQIVTCIRHLEETIKAEASAGRPIPAARQHFVSRIAWSLERFPGAVCAISVCNGMFEQRPVEKQSFLELMDLLKDCLSPFSKFEDDSFGSSSSSTVAAYKEEMDTAALLASKQCRFFVDLILALTLSFANVALTQDKQALSALCQRVLHECAGFQTEAAGTNPIQFEVNESNRKIKAMCLEQALHKLEAYINDALMRLVFTCFWDFERYSVEKLRNTMRNTPALDNPVVDAFIADFDVNLDRCNQIGIFAIAFASDMKIKTILRSVLASFEALDTCLVPSLHTPNVDPYSELLEKHFNAEKATFKKALQEVIESDAIVGCYLEMLSKCIDSMSTRYEKSELQAMTEMAIFVQEHFDVDLNKKLLLDTKYPGRKTYFDQFNAMLGECRAILDCAEQVDTQRILKRFKIMRSVLRKLHKSVKHCTKTGRYKFSENEFINPDKLSDEPDLSESVSISPTSTKLLHNSEILSANRRELPASDSLRANCSNSYANDNSPSTSRQAENRSTVENRLNMAKLPTAQRRSVRRKESLRTAMFRRQNMTESEQRYNNSINQSASLQISAILDELTNLTSNIPENGHNSEDRGASTT